MTVAPYFDCWWSNLPPWPFEAVISRERSIPSQVFFQSDFGTVGLLRQTRRFTIETESESS
jgi:hypothetical protein